MMSYGNNDAVTLGKHGFSGLPKARLHSPYRGKHSKNFTYRKLFWNARKTAYFQEQFTRLTLAYESIKTRLTVLFGLIQLKTALPCSHDRGNAVTRSHGERLRIHAQNGNELVHEFIKMSRFLPCARGSKPHMDG